MLLSQKTLYSYKYFTSSVTLFSTYLIIGSEEMRKIHLPIVVVLVTLAFLLGASVRAQDAFTLTVLIHQNPPLVDFMNDFNTKFQEKYPNVTVDMAVVN